MTKQNITIIEPTEAQKYRSHLVTSVHDMLYDQFVINKKYGYAKLKKVYVVEKIVWMIEFLIDNADKDIFPNIASMYLDAQKPQPPQKFYSWCDSQESIPNGSDYYPVKLEHLEFIANALYKYAAMRECYFEEMNGWFYPNEWVLPTMVVPTNCKLSRLYPRQKRKLI